MHTLPAADNSWAEAIELCLAHLDKSADGEVSEKLEFTVTVAELPAEEAETTDEAQNEVVAFAETQAAPSDETTAPASAADTLKESAPDVDETTLPDASAETAEATSADTQEVSPAAATDEGEEITAPAAIAPPVATVKADAKDELAEAAAEWPKLEDLDFAEAETVSLIAEEDSRVDYATKDIEAFTPSFARSTGALPAPAARHGGGPAIAELVAARAEIRRLETRCANLEESHHEAGKLQARRQADFDNYRRRVEREREEMRFLMVGEVVKQLMPLVDNLLRALAMQAREATTPENDPQHFVQGVQLIAQQLDDILSNLGIEIVPSVGHPFDPEIHEAVALDATAAFPPQTVSQEILRGYRLGARVLRPAMVKVAAPPAPAPAEN